MTNSEGQPADTPSFEQAYSELQRIVESLEKGNLPLEETLALYERGTMLYRHCANLLKNAELRIRLLSAELDVSEAGEQFDVEQRQD